VKCERLRTDIRDIAIRTFFWQPCTRREFYGAPPMAGDTIGEKSLSHSRRRGLPCHDSRFLQRLGEGYRFYLLRVSVTLSFAAC
jgi:hypothetical protein